MRSASLGVSPDTGSRVMSLTEKIPNCMPCLLHSPSLRRAGRSRSGRAAQIYAFACI
jgi:hypothetical protein